MTTFSTAYLRLTPEARKALAALVGSKTSYLRHVAHGRKQISLPLADAIVGALATHRVTFDTLPLSDAARRQHEARLRAHKTR